MAENRKLSIINSKGSLDMALPGLIIANAALSEGVDVNLFFTFWGMDIINKQKMNNLKFVPLANPSSGFPNIMCVLPGMTAMATGMMKKTLKELDVPPIEEFLQMVKDAGGKFYGCKMSADMMKLTMADLWEGTEDIISASKFIEISEGGQIIFV
jgi:peroxiredoxin family protein